MKNRIRLLAAAAVAAAAAFAAVGRATGEEEEPPEVALGERLFLETRFAQQFAAASGGDVNARVPGDPVVARTATTRAPLPGPFRGQAMNCRACHLVDEHGGAPRGGVRTYADFARRSPVPDRGDGQSVTLRNAPSLVDAARAFGEDAPLLHFDGEFGTPEDLVVGTFTGRNYGWLPGEKGAAVAHIARVLRRDDGTGELARESGGAYAPLLAALPPPFRVDAATASDQALVDAAARLVGAYMRSLHFGRDDLGRPEGSSYDAFLRDNDLPRRPRPGETDAAYTDRLRAAVAALKSPRFVSHQGALRLHGRLLRFGRTELLGLKAFLARPADAPGALSGVGNCAACHTAPLFTDRRFHATGVSQVEYDGIHGSGAFLALPVPTLANRPADLRPFSSIPDAAFPARADLGLWSVFGNPAIPGPQASIRSALGAGDDETLLLRALAAFKTPSLRDLGQSGPYMHDGSKDRVADAVSFYAGASDLARAGTLRNGDPAMAGIRISPADIRRLAAFLRSLDEDYD